jgi:hypothetical protein
MESSANTAATTPNVAPILAVWIQPSPCLLQTQHSDPHTGVAIARLAKLFDFSFMTVWPILMI